MRTCSKCRKTKSKKEFREYSPSAMCTDCLKPYTKKYYSKNKEYFLKKNQERREEIRAYIVSLKDNKPCDRCKVTHRYFALDYDHRDPTAKTINISRIANGGTKEMVDQEVAKCDLLCANCHRYKTHG